MAIERKGESKVDDLSQESKKAMQDAQREGRPAAGVEIRPGGGGPAGRNGLNKNTALGYNPNGRGEGLEKNEGPERDTKAPERKGVDSDGANYSDLSDYEHGGGARRNDFDDLRKDDDGSNSDFDGNIKPSGSGYQYNGIYENGLDGPSGGINPLGRGKGLEKEEEEKDKDPDKDPEKDPNGNPENPEEPNGEGGNTGDDPDKAEADKELLDQSKKDAEAAGLSGDDIDHSMEAAKGYDEKQQQNKDPEDALNEQMQENEEKNREQLEGEKEKAAAAEEEEEEKKKKKDEEEKAKEEGTAVAAGGLASNPSALQGNQLGNGYGNPNQQNKMDEINRRNLEHNQQMNRGNDEDRFGTPKGEPPKANRVESAGDGKAEGKGKGETKKNGEGKAEPGKKKNKFMGKARNAIDKAKNVDEWMHNPARMGEDAIKNWLVGLLMNHPMVIFALIFGLFFAFTMLLVVLSAGGDGNGSKRSTFSGSGCNYTNLKGITTSGTVDLSNIKVEIINCDGTQSNYDVIEYVDFEKYTVGVALAEVSFSKNQEYFKAQIVAARGFALTRNKHMCPSRPDNCFYGYNSITKTIRMRGCVNDQVYCDYDKACYHYKRDGKKTIYGTEAERMSGSTIWKGKLDESTKSAVLAAADEVKGKVLVDGDGNVVYTNFVNTDQNQWYQMAQQGMKWDEILINHYSSSGASAYQSATCGTGFGSTSGQTGQTGSISYGNYSLDSTGDEVLLERLDGFLEKKGTSLEAFNELISKNVNDAGYATRAGVVAAAVTLIGELSDQYDVKISYYLGGGHADGVAVGAVGYWGGPTEDRPNGRTCKWSNAGKRYDVCGLDCSGFVPWAFKTGGFNMGQNYASKFQYLAGAEKVSLNANQAVVQAGDLLESSQHVILVIGIDEGAKQYICAESSRVFEGLVFSRRSFSENGYWGVKMDGYYANSANVRSQ